jgi:hypothetical protein
MTTTIVWFNLIVSLASAAWAAVAVFRPASLSNSRQVTEGEKFYVRMYAARALPFGLAIGALPFWGGGFAVESILIAAAFVQIADIVIAVQRKNLGMICGAATGAIAHLACAFVLY